MEPDSLKHHIEDICRVSKFLDPEEFQPYDLKGAKLEEYLAYSNKRLDIVRSKFEELGFKADLQEFSHYGFRVANAVFKKGESGDETWFVAHHDYCAGLGAEDDASGLAVMIEIARHFKDSEIGEKLVFASFDLEERGLLGSEYFVNHLPKESRKKIRYVIDLECLGSGKDITICKKVYGAKSDKRLVKKIQKTASDLGYNFIPEKYGFFWADHVPFARKGIRVAEICSVDYSAYRMFGGKVAPDREDGSIAHTVRDLPENIDADNLVKVGKTLVNLVESEYFESF